MRRVSQKEQIEAMMTRPIPKKKIGIVHLEMVKESQCLYGTGRFHGPKDLVEMIQPMCQKAHQEMVLVCTTNSKLEIQAVEIVAVGGLNACYVDMRDVFKLAVASNAAHIICLHNHPSGDPEPSYEDSRLTKRLKEAGKILGIQLLDHIILGEAGRYYSFEESDAGFHDEDEKTA